MDVLHGQCRCGNSDPSQFWKLANPDDRNDLWGICCKNRSCNSEYLVSQFREHVSAPITYGNRQFYFKRQHNYQMDSDSLANLSRDPVRDIKNLNPGDHVGFERIKGNWHHVIVTRVVVRPFGISVYVINWNKDHATWIKSCLCEVNLKSDFKMAYRFRYTRDELLRNPPKLVLARAKSRLLPTDQASACSRLFVTGDYNECYGLLNQNCENLAMYCKLGARKVMVVMNILWHDMTFSVGNGLAQQVVWLYGKILSSIIAFGKRASPKVLVQSCKTILSHPRITAIMGSEIFENVIQCLANIDRKYLEAAGVGLVVISELISFGVFYYRMTDDPTIDEETRKEEIWLRFLECVLTIIVFGAFGALTCVIGISVGAEIAIALGLSALCKCVLPQWTYHLISWFSGTTEAIAETILERLRAHMSSRQLHLQ